MKSLTRGLVALIMWLLILFISTASFAQTEDEMDCYFSEDPNQNPLPAVPVLQDTSLRVALLFVQFADWETNVRARGSVGWKFEDQPDSVIYDKYRYYHFWDMYFTKNTYIDPGDTATIHPDRFSHPNLNLRVYGSFRDYWWEVSHKNLAINPAVTHPDSTQLDTTSIFYTGIINNYNPADSTIIWITLDQPISYYYVSPTDTNLTGFYL